MSDAYRLALWTGTGSFDGTLYSADVARALNLLAPRERRSANAALSLFPTSRHQVAFPTARPDRPAWLGEMDPIPVIGLNDDADIVSVGELASTLAPVERGLLGTRA